MLMLEGPCGLAWLVLMWDKEVVRTVSVPSRPDCKGPEGSTALAKHNTSRCQEGWMGSMQTASPAGIPEGGRARVESRANCRKTELRTVWNSGRSFRSHCQSPKTPSDATMGTLQTVTICSGVIVLYFLSNLRPLSSYCWTLFFHKQEIEHMDRLSGRQ